ncbi:YchJ family protein [Legionella israelensis]|uniref:Putative SEC-C motif domain protein n=1 Tax=Legionella israelensis TaxID=454 RepID=A0A0W0VHX3_9GAMM|nr:YchJ family metal-binding protein [Legionella israelensis]KTD19643.1 putative SEC-C motif domain protein [Legionella israelensis]QBS09095.1 hypothetical protein E4T55_04035 [Legionella israelensis]SCY09070.1 SEC-C motif-containing protein [Legionella israelensis DSM 19235]STX58815.1 putative SEC-C motif domain protein [Legionella israelensis]
MKSCPCGSPSDYEHCCAPYHKNIKKAENPETLMRSRYSAYYFANMDYIERTMKGKALVGFDKEAMQKRAQHVCWLNLQVLSAETPQPKKGYVEFVAKYMEADKIKSIHEISEFARIDDAWFYIDGKHSQQIKQKKEEKINRNQPCPCGSQRKYKNCHAKNRI